jgi:hypothetical protein
MAGVRGRVVALPKPHKSGRPPSMHPLEPWLGCVGHVHGPHTSAWRVWTASARHTWRFSPPLAATFSFSPHAPTKHSPANPPTPPPAWPPPCAPPPAPWPPSPKTPAWAPKSRKPCPPPRRRRPRLAVAACCQVGAAGSRPSSPRRPPPTTRPTKPPPPFSAANSPSWPRCRAVATPCSATWARRPGRRSSPPGQRRPITSRPPSKRNPYSPVAKCRAGWRSTGRQQRSWCRARSRSPGRG